MTKTNNTKKIATFLINAYVTKVENQQKYIIDNDIKIVTAISEVASIKALFPKQKDYEGFKKAMTKAGYARLLEAKYKNELTAVYALAKLTRHIAVFLNSKNVTDFKFQTLRGLHNVVATKIDVITNPELGKNGDERKEIAITRAKKARATKSKKPTASQVGNGQVTKISLVENFIEAWGTNGFGDMEKVMEFLASKDCQKINDLSVELYGNFDDVKKEATK